MNFLTNQLARWIFSLPFIVFGIIHIMGAENMSGMIAGKVPGNPSIWIYITGIALIASGLGIALQKFDRIAALGLALMLFVFIAVVHAPGLSSADAMVKGISMASLLKDLALAGGALTYAGLASQKV